MVGRLAIIGMAVSCGARSEIGYLATGRTDGGARIDAHSTTTVFEGGTTSHADSGTAPEPDSGVPTDATVVTTHGCLLLGADIDLPTSTAWSWSGASWTELSPAVAPNARISAAMATPDGEVVVFGGYGVLNSNETTYLGDTWTWDGTTWTQVFPTQSPAARDSAVVATLNGKVYLFGGESPASVLADTWEWDGSSWTELHPAQSPSGRSGAAVAVLNGRVVVFGGIVGQYGQAKLVNETWEWDGVTWTQRTLATSPSPRHAAAAATLGNAVVLFGGQIDAADFTTAYLSDTWMWDGTTWTQLEPATSPPARGYAVAGATGGEVVVAGGLRPPPDAGPVALDDTWVWNGASWTQPHVPEPSALDLDEGAMACF